jgi:ribonucleoside-diphosphate reductase alpha chain
LGAIGDDRERARDAVVRAFAAAPDEKSLPEVAERVAVSVAAAEPAAGRERWRARFLRWLGASLFLPSVPTLANAGRGGQLAACFVLETEDSLASIYQTLARAAAIQQGSGGTGVELSALRPAGTPIERAGGASSGPVGFLELFASSARINRQAGRRPGAHLAVLRHDHPDVLSYVRAKRDHARALAGVGLALAVRDSLFEALDRGGSVELTHPAGRRAGRFPASELLREIALGVHSTGEPSLLFLDTIERSNPAPELGPLRATNPCGEQPLLPEESCVLGSLHLPAFADAAGEIDFAALSEATHDAVRFLDDLIDVNAYPDPAIAEATRRTRKIGIGVMGLADLLLLRGIHYGSSGSRKLVRALFHFVHERAAEASEALAAERGAFPAWHGRGAMRRNASVLAIAPTGTLRLIAGCNGGIEPFLRPVLRVRTSRGDALWVDPWIEEWLRRHGLASDALFEALRRDEPADALPGLGSAARHLLRRAWEIPGDEQIEVLAEIQRHVDGAVSKTVHLGTETDPAEIERLIRLAHRLGCKGISFFRRGCAADAGPPAAGQPDLRLDTPVWLGASSGDASS